MGALCTQTNVELTHRTKLQPVHDPRHDLPSLPGGLRLSDGRLHLVRALQRAHVAPDVAQYARGRGFLPRGRHAEPCGAVLCCLRLHHRHLGRHLHHAFVDSKHVCPDKGEEGRRRRAAEHVGCLDVDLDPGT